jgi:potassium efflux system protein
MQRIFHSLLLLLLVGLLSFAPQWTQAASAAAPEPTATITTPAPAIALAIAPSSDPATQQAQNRLQQAQQRIAAAQNVLKNGASELAQLSQQLSIQPSPPTIDVLDIPALEALQQQFQVAEQAANSELQTRQQALDALEQPTPPAPIPAAPLVEANPSPATQKLLALQKEADNAEAQARAIEISVQPLAIQVAQARVKLSQSLRNQARLILSAIDARLSTLRLEAARATLRATDSSANSARAPQLKSLVEANENLAQILINLTEHLDQLNQQSSQLNAQTEAMGNDMALLQRQLQQFGFGPVMGNLLLAKRASLPSERDLAAKSKDNRELLERLQLLDIKLRDEHQVLIDPTARINTILAALPKDDQTTLRNEVSTLIELRLSLLPKLEAIKPQILQAIANKEEALAAQRRQMDEFQDFINKNLLWLPNERPLWNQDLPSSWHELHSIFNTDALQRLIQEQVQTFRTEPLVILPGLGLIIVLLTFRRRLKQRLRGVIDSANHNNFKVLPSSLQIIFLALLLALPLPLLFVGIGLLFNASSTALSSSLAAAFFTIAPLWLNARLFLTLTQPNGLAEKLFNWHPLSLNALRKAFRLYLYTATPLAFMTGYMLTFCIKAGLDAGSGQVVFILLVLLLAFIFGRLTHPHGALVRHWRAEHPNHGFTRFAGLFFWLGISLFLLFAGMIAVGYTYSAGVLVKNLGATLWVLLVLSIIRGFAQIALQQAYRRIAVQRIELAQQASNVLPPQEHDLDNESIPNRPIITADTPIDISQVNQQSQQLLSFSLNLGLLFALYFVWAPILPALTLLDQINLWNVQSVVDGNTITSAVSLGDALLSGVLLTAMWVAARNLPGLMEIVLAQWTHQDAGTRYAIVSILRYIIIASGIVILLGGLGVQWSQLQWLVAALGVGLGFGLQEIFANFVSGIIILLERPVRVGDLVSVGSNTGFIRRIHIRSTVLEDYDRKEIIVPNKTLITGEVTNWTLSDTSARLLIDIGVAYGTDTRLVERLLLNAASKVPRLMTDPAPVVWFVSFGDSALNFRLRGFVANADIKLGVTSELNYIIEQTLREHGVNIPFPQRDVHHFGLEPLADALLQRSQEANATQPNIVANALNTP